MGDVTAAATAARPVVHRRRAVWAAVSLLLAIHAALAVGSGQQLSNIFDETLHLGGGYSYWLRNDYRMQPENGLLPQRLAALPLLVIRPNFPAADDPQWTRLNHWAIGGRFLYEEGNDPDVILTAGRAMITLVSVLLAVTVFRWSRRLFGTAGGLLSLTLYAFSPTMLAHASVVTSDLVAAAFFIFASAATWRVLHRITPATVAVAALALGGLALAKASGVLFVPMAAILLIAKIAAGRPLKLRFGRRARHVRGRAAQAAILVALGVAEFAAVIVLIWAGYGFRFAAGGDPPGTDVFILPWESFLTAVGGAKGAIIAWLRQYQLLPEAFLYGIVYVLVTTRIRHSFLLGDHSYNGFFWFFPYAFLIKTPLPLFGLLGLAAATVLRACGAAGRWGGWGFRAVYRALPLWVLLGVYVVTSLATALNIGHRHLLPIYPVLFIFAGAAARWLASPRAAVRWMVPALTAAFIAVSLWTWPNYLSFFNSLIGGPKRAHHHLIDSSLDWGQNLPALRDYLQERGLLGPSDTPVYVAYFGTASPEHYGLKPIYLPSYFRRSKVEGPPRPLRPGVYAISASLLHAVYVPVQGPYTAEAEERYQGVARLMRLWWRAEETGDEATLAAITAQFGATPEEQQANLLVAFENYVNLRFARLTAYLREREPDDHAAPSILIYNLDENELREALEGPIDVKPPPW